MFYVSMFLGSKSGALSEWTEPIRNHFWFIAQECNGSIETLKVRCQLLSSQSTSSKLSLQI